MYQPKHQALHQPKGLCISPKCKVRNLSRENATNSPPELRSCARPEAGAGDGVSGVVAAVDVVLDALVGSGVKRSAGNTVSAAAARVGGAGAGDLDVDALGVGLGAVLLWLLLVCVVVVFVNIRSYLACGVQGDDLVAEDVVARGEGLGDVDGPLVAVGDELVGAPLVGGGVDDTDLSELEEAQALLVGVGAVARALGQVVDDRAVVGLGPGVPLESHGAAGSDRDRGLARSGFLKWGLESL